MTHKTLRLIALLVLVFAVVLTGCRRSTPITDPPAPEPPGPEEPVDPPPVVPEPEEPDTAPSFLGELETLSFSVGARIWPVFLPEATGGDGPLTYSLDPMMLPPGLNYHPDFRVIFGTPLAEGDYEVTYLVEDSDDNHDPSDSAAFEFVISVGPGIPVSELLAAVNVGEAEGVLRLEPPPEASDGPSVEVVGNHALVSGGAIFVSVTPDAELDKLLLSIDMQSYYEIDLTGAMSPYRLVGHVPPGIEAFSALCLSLMGVAADGTVGAPECHPLEVVPTGTGDLEIAVSWDTDADLDLHVVDANGHEIYWGREMVDSGGEYDLESGADCIPDGVRTEHVAWTGGTPPPGTYVVRVNYWSGCDNLETNYVVNVTYNGERTTYPGTLEGPGEESGGRGSGEVIALFTVPGPAPPPVTPAITADYRGSGDQVFVLNPEGEVLDDTLVTLNLGSTPAEVYVIASNTSHYPMEPQVERLDIMEAAIKGNRAAHHEEYSSQPRPAPSEAAPDRPEVTEFNNYHPLTGDGSSKRSARLLQEAEPGVAEGDTFTFLDLDYPDTIEIPATARRVITDQSVTLAVWVADADWATACDTGQDIGGGGQPRAAHTIERACVNQELVDTLAEAFLQAGAGNDIYDWVTGIFGAPWGPHGFSFLIPPEAADEIHVLLFDIDGDGVPAPGQSRIVGFFFAKDNWLRNPDHPLYRTSNERLTFYIDAPYLTFRPNVAITTLAHEFQHMIHYYQKRVVQGAASEAWMNEMASEVAEDLVADKMEADGPRAVDHDDPTAGEPEIIRGRLPGFNLYNDLQVTRWDRLLANYSINYAFGAYLARNYGGAALFSAIVQSDQSGADAIEGALRDLGHDISFGEALANWGPAVLLSDNTAAPSPYAYNTGDWRYSRNGGLEYQLGSINLFNYVYVPRGADGRISRLALEGPYLHSLDSLNETTLESHSNRYVFLGRNSGTIRLNVSAVTDNRITVVVKE